MFSPSENNRCSAGNLPVQNHESCIKQRQSVAVTGKYQAW